MARRALPAIARAGLTIDEFCKRYSIGRATFYSWQKAGVGPALLQPSGPRGRVIIPIESEIAWRERHTTRTVTVEAAE